MKCKNRTHNWRPHEKTTPCIALVNVALLPSTFCLNIPPLCIIVQINNDYNDELTQCYAQVHLTYCGNKLCVHYHITVCNFRLKPNDSIGSGLIGLSLKALFMNIYARSVVIQAHDSDYSRILATVMV